MENLEQILFARLSVFVAENNPEIIATLSYQVSVLDFLNGKVSIAVAMAEELAGKGKSRDEIMEACFSVVTADLRPSKFQYVCTVLKEEFPAEYAAYERDGVLKSEGIAITLAARDIFGAHSFSQRNHESSLLRHAVIQLIHEHLLR